MRTFFPPNRVLYLLIHVLTVVFGVLVLHTTMALQTPSSITVFLLNSLPFLYLSHAPLIPDPASGVSSLFSFSEPPTLCSKRILCATASVTLTRSRHL